LPWTADFYEKYTLPNRIDLSQVHTLDNLIIFSGNIRAKRLTDLKEWV